MYTEEIINAARESVIGKKYMAFVLYTSNGSAAVVDVIHGNPKNDWEIALSIADERAAAWCSNNEVNSEKLNPCIDPNVCVEFCVNIPLPIAGFSYHVNYVEMK